MQYNTLLAVNLSKVHLTAVIAAADNSNKVYPHLLQHVDQEVIYSLLSFHCKGHSGEFINDEAEEVEDFVDSLRVRDTFT